MRDASKIGGCLRKRQMAAALEVQGCKPRSSTRFFPQQPSFLPCYFLTNQGRGRQFHQDVPTQSKCEKRAKIPPLCKGQFHHWSPSLRVRGGGCQRGGGRLSLASPGTAGIYNCAAPDCAVVWFRRGHTGDVAGCDHFRCISFPTARQFERNGQFGAVQSGLDAADWSVIFFSIRSADLRTAPALDFYELARMPGTTASASGAS